MKTLDTTKMRMSDGHTLAVYHRAARWQRIRIDRRRWRIMQGVLALDVLTVLGWVLLAYLWVTK